MEATNVLRAFVDTNILIQGPRRAEHHELKRLSQEGRITLIGSLENRWEQRARSRTLREKNWIFWRLYELVKTHETRQLLEGALDEEDKLRQAEKAEMNFWKDAKLTRPWSNLDTAYNMGILGTDVALQFDTKREIQLAAELVDKYGLRQMDAMLLMQAHSLGVDFETLPV